MNVERIINLRGAYNFRDLGGYAARDGRRIKWRTVFRSDDLNDLNMKDRALLAGMGLKTVVDFRDPIEQKGSPDRLPESVERYIAAPVEAGRVLCGVKNWGDNDNKSVGIMLTAYQAMINDFQDAFRQLFRLLEDAGNTPLLFHCVVGKDRTGLAAALFLASLGVDKETIWEDYLLSNECLEKKTVAGPAYDYALHSKVGVEPGFLQAGLSWCLREVSKHFLFVN